MNSVLGRLRDRGVTIWMEAGVVRYRAPRGVLTGGDIEWLRQQKDELSVLLQNEANECGVSSETSTWLQNGRIPLLFSQKAHWNRYDLSTRRAIRQIASAVRVVGPLDRSILQLSVEETVRRHEAFRIRIVVMEGEPFQEIGDIQNIEVSYLDLSSEDKCTRESKLLQVLESYILQPIDVRVDPLFGFLLVKMGEDEHALVVVMEHLIADAVSMSIVLSEVFTAYAQLVDGGTLLLPAVSAQFSDFVTWVRDTVGRRRDKYGSYWQETLLKCPRHRFPEDDAGSDPARIGWGSIQTSLGKELTHSLKEWCRRNRTTAVIAVLCAYAALLLRWCNTAETLIQYQSDGRSSPKFSNTVGYLASVLYLRVSLERSENFSSLKNKLMESYYLAQERADFSYLQSQVPTSELICNSSFNWISQGPTTVPDIRILGGNFECSSIRFSHPMLRTLVLDSEPSILIFDLDDDIAVDVRFPLSRFSAESMKHFVRNFRLFVESLVCRPEQQISAISLI